QCRCGSARQTELAERCSQSVSGNRGPETRFFGETGFLSTFSDTLSKRCFFLDLRGPCLDHENRPALLIVSRNENRFRWAKPCSSANCHHVSPSPSLWRWPVTLPHRHKKPAGKARRNCLPPRNASL